MAFDSWPVKAKKYSFEETSECGTRRAFDSWPVKKKKYSFEEISECRSRLASDSWKGSPHEEDCSAHQIINTFMMPKLYAAATTGDVGEFEKVVNGDAERTPIEDVTPRGNSVLHIAASFGHDGIVNFILQNCPKLFEFENHKGDLALHVAASSGYLTVVKSLVSFAQKAAPTESPNTLGTSLLGKVNLKGNTALHVALENCQRETALFLVQADPQVSHCPNWEGKSPFYMAAKSGYLEIVESIITVVRSTLDSYNQGQSVEHEADSSKLELNYLNDENHNASVHPNLEGYRLLHASIIGRNKDVMGKIWSMDSSLVYSIDENGLTPLSLAASIGFIEGVCYILDNSTDSTYQTDREGFFPIHRACMGGHIEIIDVFLKRHPDSAELLNNGGENILHVAAKNGRAKLVSWMLELSTLDMLINEKDEDGFTPLHWAAQNCHPKVVSILTSDKRVNLEIMNNRGLTALDIAEKNIDSSAPFRNRLTRTALKSANAPRSEKAKRQRNKPSSSKFI